MYSEQVMYDSDSVNSFSSSSSSSPKVDGVAYSDNLHEWFQAEQQYANDPQNAGSESLYQQSMTETQYRTISEAAPIVTEGAMYSNLLAAQPYWTVDGQSSQNYTYIFDSVPGYNANGHGQTETRVDKSGKMKRRRVQTPYQRKAANVRERRRMCTMNEAFDELRKRLPAFEYEKKLSRIETLKLAMTYISFMKDLSDGMDPSDASLRQYQNFKEKVLQSMEEHSS